MSTEAEQISPPPPAYPVRFEADYVEPLSRLSTLFRLILMIPLLIVAGILTSGLDVSSREETARRSLEFSSGTLGGLIVVHWIAVLLRRRPVAWIFDTIVAIQRFALRALTYVLLLRDRYPPFEGEWSVRYEVDRPEQLSRRQLVIWKTIASIPHFIVLLVLWFVVATVTVIAWFVILFSGRYPKGLHDLVSGWLRWYARVGAYWISLTDRYPPFSLD
jgi:hypothetical protein